MLVTRFHTHTEQRAILYPLENSTGQRPCTALYTSLLDCICSGRYVANYVVHESFRNLVAQLHNKSIPPSLRLYPDPYVSSPHPNFLFLRSVLLLRNIVLGLSMVSSLQVFPYFFSSSCAARPAYHILHLVIL